MNKPKHTKLSWILGLIVAVAPLASQAALDFRVYGSAALGGFDIAGAAVADLTADSQYPDEPSAVELVTALPGEPGINLIELTTGNFEFRQTVNGFAQGNSGLDNYGGAISGLLYAPADGSYTFHVRSDDASQFFLSTDADADNMVLLAEETGCCGGFTKDAPEGSEAVELEKGQAYYFEFLFKEGGGGDWFQVGWALDGGEIEVIPAAYLQRDISSRVSDLIEEPLDFFTTPNDFMDLEPFVTENIETSIDFIVEFNKDGAAAIQWQMNDGGGWDDIEGAVSPLLTVDISVDKDGNQYRAKVDDETSMAYTLIVEPDTEAPTVRFVSHRGNPNAFIAAFSEPVDPDSALDLSNYEFDGKPLPEGTTISLNDAGTEVIVLGPFNMEEGDRKSVSFSGIVDRAATPNEIEGFDKTLAYVGGEGITYDFNDGIPTDGDGNPIMELFGNAEVRDSGGVGDSGYLKITDGAGSQLGAALITQRIDVQQVIFSFDARIGDTSGRPADGWSFNVADDMPTGTYQQSEEGYRGGESDPPQGLVVAGDNWSSGGADLGVGIEVKYAGESRAFVATPEVTSGGAPTESPEGIPSIHRGDRWFPVSIALGEDGTATVVYDGVTIMENEPVGWEGVSDAQIGFGARTGGAWESHWFDNVNINLSGGPIGPVTMEQQPEGVSGAAEHSQVTLSAIAGGATYGRSFQWYKVGGGAGVAGNISNVSLADGNIAITYVGSLESSDSVNGPWTAVASSATEATYSEAASGNEKFFRVLDAAGGGDGEGVMLEGETSSSLSFTATPAAAGQYYVVASNWFSDVQSDTVSVTVVPDTVAPMVVSVSGSPLNNSATVTFSEPVSEETAGNADNYSIEGLEITGVTVSNPTTVSVMTADQADGTPYQLSVSGVADLAQTPNVTDGTPNEFISFEEGFGGLTVLFYDHGGTSLDFYPEEDRGRGLYPDNFNPFGTGPNITDIGNRNSSTTPYFEAPATGDINVVPPSGVANDYALVVYGYIVPPQTGNYRFGIGADDNAALYLSSDDDPENATLIANENEWNSRREYDKDINKSEPIFLEEGERYYVEALMSEGGGGDNLAVAWEFAPDGEEPADIANGTLPIAGEYLISNLPVYRFPELLAASPADGANGFQADTGTASFTFQDGKFSPMDTDSVEVKLGDEMLESEVTAGGNITITAALPELLDLNTSYTITVSYGVGGSDEPMTHTFTFQTEDIPTLANKAADVGAGGNSGMLVNARQSTEGRGNSTEDAEAQIAGGGDLFEADNVEVIYINHNQDVGGNAGRFGDDIGMFDAGLMDEINTDNISWEVLTYVEFPEAGIVTMAVNSDDGFRVTHGEEPALNDDDQVLGVFSGGRGASDTIFRFVVPEPGIYPMRLLWYEGGGGANVEWWTLDADGVRHLINGPDDSAAFKAYQDVN